MTRKLYLGDNFYKSTFNAELQCGNQTCLQMSSAESKICKPLIKPTKKLKQHVLVLLILEAFSIFFMVFFDLLFLKSQNGHESSNKPISTGLFTVIIAVSILCLSSGSFYKPLFCSMNIREKICKEQDNYNHEGALHTKENPIYVSAPCKILTSAFTSTLGRERDYDILNVNHTVSPCTLELRTNFFIENFEMIGATNPNNFESLSNLEPIRSSGKFPFFELELLFEILYLLLIESFLTFDFKLFFILKNLQLIVSCTASCRKLTFSALYHHIKILPKWCM